MNDQKKTFWLGVFIIAALVLAAGFILFLRPSVGDGQVTLRVHFSNIEEIRKGTRVTYAGKPVGIVHEIYLIQDPRKGPKDASGNLFMYEVVLKLDSGVKIFSYDEIDYSTTGLLGEKYISIQPKAPPLGAPAGREVTEEILYARSTDMLQDVLSQLNQLAGTVNETMRGIHGFLNENSESFQKILNTLNSASEEIQISAKKFNESDIALKAANAFEVLEKTMVKADTFINEFNETKLVERVNLSFSNFDSFLSRIERGEGTMGRLFSSDSFYLQLTAVIANLQTVLSDISNYGLLFQYDKSWQRQRLAKRNYINKLQTPCDFSYYFDQEMAGVDAALCRTETFVNTVRANPSIDSECFSENLLQLLARVEHLQSSLKRYTEILMQEYCQKCGCD